MKTYISILVQGYYSATALWAKLQLEDINSETGYDNGFLICSVDKRDTKKAVSLIQRKLSPKGKGAHLMKSKFRIMLQHTSRVKAREARDNYWKNLETTKA